jgi:hypothetical protein
MKNHLLWALIFASCCFVAGCDSSDHMKSADEEKSFKGGPMPADFKARFEASKNQDVASIRQQQQNKAEAKANGAAPTTK